MIMAVLEAMQSSTKGLNRFLRSLPQMDNVEAFVRHQTRLLLVFVHLAVNVYVSYPPI